MIKDAKQSCGQPRHQGNGFKLHPEVGIIEIGQGHRELEHLVLSEVMFSDVNNHEVGPSLLGDRVNEINLGVVHRMRHPILVSYPLKNLVAISRWAIADI